MVSSSQIFIEDIVVQKFAFGAGLLVLAAMSTESGRANIKKAVRSLVWTGYFARGAAADLVQKAKKCRTDFLAKKETAVEANT
jgi:hypothetical protein